MATYLRSDWGAGPHRAGTIRLPVRDLFLHHTVTPFWTGAQAARNVQAIARSRGFVDISYSWLTDWAGNEIEGRGWGRSGAHTRGHNSTAHALSLVGNLDTTPMPDGMIRGAVRIIRRHGHVGPQRITRPHSAVSATACPGRYPRAKIAQMNAAAAGGSAPSPPPQTGDWFEMATKQDLRDVLNEGTGAGQRNWASTHRAILSTVQGLVNRLNATRGDVRAAKQAAETLSVQEQMVMIHAFTEAVRTHEPLREELRKLFREANDS